jgi:hypothetical protein
MNWIWMQSRCPVKTSTTVSRHWVIALRSSALLAHALCEYLRLLRAFVVRFPALLSSVRLRGGCRGQSSIRWKWYRLSTRIQPSA